MLIGYLRTKSWTIRAAENDLNMKSLLLRQVCFGVQVVQVDLPASIQFLLSGMHL